MEQTVEQRNARMLALLYLIILVVGSMLSIINISLARPEARPGQMWGSLATLAITLLGYALARTLISLLIFSIGFSVMVLLSFTNRSSDYLLPVYLIVPVLMVSAFANLRIAILTGFVNLLLILFATIQISEASNQAFLIGSVQFYLLVSGIALLMTHQNVRDF